MEKDEFRSLIETAGIRQSDAAWMLGISSRSVRYMLAGKYPIPQYAYLIVQAYADDLLTPEWLADHIDQPMK
tara:strand:- start:5036 stop:5251 length:216 start_codon:yes stop_codon:yes gene_type:complete